MDSAELVAMAHGAWQYTREQKVDNMGDMSIRPDGEGLALYFGDKSACAVELMRGSITIEGYGYTVITAKFVVPCNQAEGADNALNEGTP